MMRAGQRPNGEVCPVGQEWFEHRREAKTAMLRVGEMHSSIGQISSHTKHLVRLDGISDSLERLETTLVGAATGRRQIPLSSHIIMMMILGAALLIVLVEKSGKTVRVGASGIEITERQEAKP